MLGLEIAKLNMSPFSSPTPSLWICTGSCLLYLAGGETGVSWPEWCSRSHLPSHLQLFCLPRLHSLHSLFRVGRKTLGVEAPQSGSVVLDVSLAGLLSLDFCVIVHIVHFKYSVVLCFAMLPLWHLGILLALEVTFLFRSVTLLTWGRRALVVCSMCQWFSYLFFFFFF